MEIVWVQWWNLQWISSSGQVVVGGCEFGSGNGGNCHSDIFTSIELFPRPPSNDCHIPNKPEAQLRRERHSLSLMQGGVLVICGGYDHRDPFDNCISWNTGNSSWAEILKWGIGARSLIMPIRIIWTTNSIQSPTSIINDNPRWWRFSHIAWTPSALPEGIIVVGGSTTLSYDSAEILPGKTMFRFCVTIEFYGVWHITGCKIPQMNS